MTFIQGRAFADASKQLCGTAKNDPSSHSIRQGGLSHEPACGVLKSTQDQPMHACLARSELPGGALPRRERNKQVNKMLSAACSPRLHQGGLVSAAAAVLYSHWHVDEVGGEYYFSSYSTPSLFPFAR